MRASLLLTAVKIAPLYGIIVAGFFAAKRMHLHRETVANVLLYVVSPIIFFNGIISAPHGWQHLILLPVFFIIGCLLSASFYYGCKKFYHQKDRGILAFAAGSGNTGYFGIPLVVAVLGPDALDIAIAATIGLDLYQYTLGYYFMSRHHVTAREAVGRIARNPIIWSLVLGILFVQFHWAIPADLATAANQFKGAYVVLGMLIIGMGLAHASRSKIDVRLTAVALLAKFAVFPLTVLFIVSIDSFYTHIFPPLTHQAMLLLSVVPIASDTVAFATAMQVNPEKAAHMVMASTIMAIFYIPIFTTVFM